VTIGRSWTNGFAAQVQIPYRYTGGGVLDSAIDSWHDFFGLPQGSRCGVAEDRVRIAYASGNTVLFDERESQSGLGDISLDFGRSLTATPATAARPG
jgi:hypothetical protein